MYYVEEHDHTLSKQMPNQSYLSLQETSLIFLMTFRLIVKDFSKL